MSFEMEADQDALSCLLEGHETTRGLYVRIWGKHLIVAREEASERVNNFETLW